uniref:Uncharacterized protein n=1 Tax=Mycena chlorophos TaxID=658473 RepID=A0ABQ0LIM7_MYCCL|nr:predicted protein [Mycena chlorophos]
MSEVRDARLRGDFLAVLLDPDFQQTPKSHSEYDPIQSHSPERIIDLFSLPKITRNHKLKPRITHESTGSPIYSES